MAWVRLDDHFGEHPKVLHAGPLAGWLYVMGLGYCNRNQTDGHIPRTMVRRLADLDDPFALAARLVAAGLWDVADDGYRVHDYLDYQQSKAEIDEIKQVRANAGSKGGKQKASNLLDVCLANGLAKSKQIAKQNSSKLPSTIKKDHTSHPIDQTTPEEEDPDEDAREAPGSPATPARSSDPPHVLWDVLCEEAGADQASLAPAFKRKQLGKAKALIEQGYGVAKVRACLRYLRSQTWRTSTIDLFTVDNEIGKWELAGMPASATGPPRASPSGKPSKMDNALEGIRRALTHDGTGTGAGDGITVRAMVSPGGLLGRGSGADHDLPGNAW